MASKCDIYTCGYQLQSAFVYSANTEAAGYPKENLLDQNPDSAWKPTAAGTNTIVLDLGTARAVSGFFFLFRNSSTLNPSANATIAISYSTDNTNWTKWDNTDDPIDDTWNLVNLNPLYIMGHAYAASQSKRYWKIVFYTPDVVPEVAGIIPWTKYSVAQGDEVPGVERHGFLRDRFENNRRVFTRTIRTVRQREMNRRWLFVGDTDWESLTLVQAFMACFGDQFPFVLMDEQNTDNRLLARFADASIERREIAYRVYEVNLGIIAEPYIKQGYSL